MSSALNAYPIELLQILHFALSLFTVQVMHYIWHESLPRVEQVKGGSSFYLKALLVDVLQVKHYVLSSLSKHV